MMTGTSRQKIISKMKVKEPIFLREYLYNDTIAIYVLNSKNEIIGNVPSQHSGKISKQLKENRIVKANVSEIDQLQNEKIYFIKIKLFIKQLEK